MPLYRTLAEALATGRLAHAAEPADGDPVLRTGPDLPEGTAAIVARTSGGDCVFHHRSSGVCVIHRTAYQGRGVLTIVRGLDAALALVRVEAARQCRNAGRRLDADLLREAFRQADFILNHLAVGEDLAAVWSHVEYRDDGPVIARPELALDGA